MIAGGILCVAGLVSWGVSRYQARQAVVEAAEIYTTLRLHSASRVADVGAGTGAHALELARALAPDGYVYATEVDLGRLAAIRVSVAEAGLDNVTTLESSRTKTGLPPGCCDGVFLRRVYHHLTDPDAIAADLFAVVRPGGRLAIIDFEPNRWLSLVSSVEGAPESRNGHGVRPGAVVAGLTAAGFILDARHDDWGSGDYCLTFVRPES